MGAIDLTHGGKALVADDAQCPLSTLSHHDQDRPKADIDLSCEKRLFTGNFVRGAEAFKYKLGATGAVSRLKMGTSTCAMRFRDMTKATYTEPSKVKARHGAVEVEGPDSVEVTLSPEAAEETADRLTDESLLARGQHRFSKLTHRPE